MPGDELEKKIDKNAETTEKSGEAAAESLRVDLTASDNEALKRTNAETNSKPVLPGVTVVGEASSNAKIGPAAVTKPVEAAPDKTAAKAAAITSDRAASPADATASWATKGDVADAIAYLERVKAMGEASLRAGRTTAGDKAQSAIYTLLQEKILKELQDSGRIGKEWKLYPSVAQSPADKVGGDFLLVNTKTGGTGEFHFLDATVNDEKKNVYRMRADAVIKAKSNYFDAMGALKTDAGGALGEEVIAWRTALEKQIVDLTKKKSDFRLGKDGTPVPSMTVKPEAQEIAEKKALSDWAAAQSAKAADQTKANDFREMSLVVNRSTDYTDKKLAEVPSPKFSESVRRATEAEVAKYAYAAAMGEKYEARSASTGSKSSVRVHADSMMLDHNGAIMNGGSVSNHMEQARASLLGGKNLLAQLSDRQLKAMGADLAAVKGLDPAARVAALEKQTDKKGPFGDNFKKIREKLINLNSEIQSGGRVGTGDPVITTNVMDRLRSSTAEANLGVLQPVTPSSRTEAPASAKPAFETMRDGMPRSTGELYDLSKDLKFERGVPSRDLADNMELILAEGEKSTWAPGELERFKALHEAYLDPKNPKHAESVEQLHELMKDNAKQEKELAAAELVQAQLRGKPEFERLTNEARMKEALSSLSDRMANMPAKPKEQADFLSTQLRAALRKQLGVAMDKDLPGNLRNLTVNIVDGEGGVRVVQNGKNAPAVIEVSASLLKSNIKGAMVEAYTQAAGLVMMEMLPVKENQEVAMRSLKPLLDEIAVKAEKLVQARTAAAAEQSKPVLTADRAASDRKPAVETAKIATAWDGENLSFGSEKFHLRTEVERVARDNAERVKDIEKKLSEAQKVVETARTTEQSEQIKVLETQLAAEKQNLHVVSELREAMNGQRGVASKDRAESLVKSAAERAIQEHQTRGRGAGAALSRTAAATMVITSLAAMFMAPAKARQGGDYQYQVQ